MDSKEMLELLLELEKAFAAQRKDLMHDLPPMRQKDKVVLQYIWNSDDHIVRMADLTSFMGVSPAVTSQLINQYEELRLAERIRSTEDRRANFVKIHPQLIDYVELKKEEAANRIDSLIDFLGEEDTEHVARLLTRIQDFALQDETN